jgi:hypothetical protein
MDGRNIAYRRISEKRKEKEKNGLICVGYFSFWSLFSASLSGAR